MSKILYFYPENPALLNQGNNSRANFLLKYFKSRNFTVDLVGEYEKRFTEKDIETLKKLKFINDGWLLKKNVRSLSHFATKILPTKIHKGLLSFISKNTLKRHLDFNRTKKGYLEDFKGIIEKNSYDIIIISYVYWAPLISKELQKLKNQILIIDTHDFITAQCKNEPHFELGSYFKKEIDTLNIFDKIWTISNEEHFVFSQFLEHKTTELIPHGSDINSKNNFFESSIDLLYVASDNPHNVSSINWFLSEVYPVLSKDLNITFIGKICHVIPKYSNITKICFADDLDAYYKNTKLVICPMLSGTGTKIKVIEALSYCIPVICNPRGVDGLLNKIENGCSVAHSAQEFSKYIKELLNDTIAYEKASKNAFNFFSTALSTQAVYSHLDNSFGVKKN